MKINEENWQSARLTSNDLLSFIAFGASFNKKNNDEPVFEYTILLTNLEYKELYSKRFLDLDLALKELNQKYGDWDLYEKAASSTGCDSCAAH